MKDILRDIPPEGHLASVNGMDMYYEAHGQGSPLILLHGLTGGTDMWQAHVGEFAKHYHTIPIDLRGHGWSTNPAGEFTHRQAGLDVFALMDHLDIDQVKGIGLSAGAMVLMHMATQQPERVEAMVLIGSSMYITEEQRAWARQFDVEDKAWWEVMRARHKRGDDQIRALGTHWRDCADSYDDVNFTPPYLSTITARTLIVHGDRDRYYPVPIAVEMYRAIPNSYLWIVPNGEHTASYRERAPLFIETALEFLSGAWEE